MAIGFRWAEVLDYDGVSQPSISLLDKLCANRISIEHLAFTITTLFIPVLRGFTAGMIASDHIAKTLMSLWFEPPHETSSDPV
jgi:hypothetical protein